MKTEKELAQMVKDLSESPLNTALLEEINLAIEDVYLQVGDLRKALQRLYDATEECTRHECRGLRNGEATAAAYIALQQGVHPGKASDSRFDEEGCGCGCPACEAGNHCFSITRFRCAL